jgi:hypothetical protein
VVQHEGEVAGEPPVGVAELGAPVAALALPVIAAVPLPSSPLGWFWPTELFSHARSLRIFYNQQIYPLPAGPSGQMANGRHTRCTYLVFLPA